MEKFKKSLFIVLLFLALLSCSNTSESCNCNEYLKTSNGNLVFNGSASKELCNGNVPNPSPNLTVYKLDCK